MYSQEDISKMIGVYKKSGGRVKEALRLLKEEYRLYPCCRYLTQAWKKDGLVPKRYYSVNGRVRKPMEGIVSERQIKNIIGSYGLGNPIAGISRLWGYPLVFVREVIKHYEYYQNLKNQKRGNGEIEYVVKKLRGGGWTVQTGRGLSLEEMIEGLNLIITCRQKPLIKD